MRSILHEGVMIGSIKLERGGWVAIRQENDTSYIFTTEDDSGIGYEKCVAMLMEEHAKFVQRSKENHQ